MNYWQVRALAALMEAAAPIRRWPDDPIPVVHVRLSVASGYDDGNTYEAALWTPASGYRFPDAFYLRSDGSVYTVDPETDEPRPPFAGVVWDAVDRTGAPSTFFRVLRVLEKDPAAV